MTRRVATPSVLHMMTVEAERPVDLEHSVVRDAMHAPVHVCPADTPLTEAATAMVTHKIHAMVVDGMPPHGDGWAILSALDLAHAAAAGTAVTAGDAAATEAVTVLAGESRRRAAQLMAEHDVSHLLVRDAGHDRPAGILSTTDIARAYASRGARTPAPLGHGPIVVGVDGSDRGADAVALARALAPVLGGRLILAHAVAALAIGRGGAAYDPIARAAAREILAAAAPDLGPEAADARIVDCLGRPRGLVELTEDVDAAALVLGSSHRGPIGRVMIGSLAEDILGQARCPIVVAPRGYRERVRPLRLIGVGYDATLDAERALDFAIGLARGTGATLRLWCVVAPTGANGRHPEKSSDFTRYIHRIAHRQLAEGLARLPEGLHGSAAVLEGSVADELAGAAERDGAGLIVVGSRGHGPVGRLLLGNTARHLMRAAPTPLAVVPHGGAPRG
jgi:nucleotide-binding universal stress UspA family protein